MSILYYATLFNTSLAKDVKTEGMPSPRDKSINFGEGRGFYNTKSLNRQSSNPFIPALNKIEPSAIENAELIWFKNAVVKVKSVSELNKVVDQALDAGIRINAYSEGQTSFADAVILKMLSIPCKENEKEDIICELMLSGAMFSYDLLQDKRISEVHNKLYQEVKPQIDERLKELKEAGENAVQGGIVEDVCIDNKTFYMKFSKDSTVKPVEVLEGARRLGLNTGCVELGGNIIKIGDSEIEVSEKGGKRNYTDLSGDAVMLELPTSIGKLNIILPLMTRSTASIRHKIAQNIRSWILKRKYNAKDLANETGIKYYTLLRYVKGKSGIPTKKLKRITKALSISVSNLLLERKPLRENSCFDKDKTQETYNFIGKYIKISEREPRKAINALTKFIRAQEESDVKAARIRMAKNMLELEFDADIIYQATGLSIDEYDNKELVVCERHKEGQEMKKWRIIREYTQEELAKELGVASSQIHNYEQGKSTFLSEVACKAAEILSVDAEDLITEEDYYESEDEEVENELLSSTREFKRIDNQESRDELNILIEFLSQRRQIYKEKIDKAEGIKVANNLLILGIPIDIIPEITGLTVEELETK